MTTTTLRETTLAPIHKELKARMVDFAGWNMPVQYSSIINEHLAVRNHVGLFDVSHMGEFTVSGSDAFNFIQHMIANDLSKLSKPNMALYTQLATDDGGTIDDLIVYRREHDFLLVVNASNIEKDWQWLNKHKADFQEVNLLNISDELCLLALQGPSAEKLWSELTGKDLSSMPAFSYDTASIDGFSVSYGRTGYTGEDGFEIFVGNAHAQALWKLIMDKGQSYNLLPCGLGARDTLRLEAGLPLYGHELDQNTSPIEAGLSWSVKLNKGDFLGRKIMQSQKEGKLTKTLVGLKAEGKALPRQGYKVYAQDGECIGTISSGSQGIFLGYPIAFAFVSPKYAQIGTKLQIEIRDNKVACEVVQRPFYKRQK